MSIIFYILESLPCKHLASCIVVSPALQLRSNSDLVAYSFLSLHSEISRLDHSRRRKACLLERQLSYFSMMEDTLEWKILPSDGPDGYDYRFPTLLIAHSFRKQEYDVYITDLRNFWCERMDRRAINKRALLTDTSIDPTEDDEQMKLLLDKIKDGLEGERSADVELILGDSRGLDTNDDEDGNVPQMAINLTVNLPKPFKPLHWKLELKPCDSSFLLSYITAPLIIAENEAREQISDLLRVIREKDHVIQKLADKLEASGTELGQVFPSAAGKGGRKLTRKTVEERVAGLSTFKYESWLKNFRLGEESNETAGASEYYGEMILRCFSSGVELPKSGHYDWNQTYERWWKPLEGETISLSKSWMSDQDENDGKKKQRDNPDEDTHNKSLEEDLQVPGTPPPASQKLQPSPSHHLQNRHVVDDDETDDEDLDATSQSQPAKVPDSFRSPEKPTSRHTAKKLGGRGGNKSTKAKSPTSPAAQPSRSSQSQTIVDDDEDTTEGEDDFEEIQPKKNAPEKEKEKASSQKRAASPTPPLEETSPKKPPKKGGLGKIGGKKKVSPPPEPENEETQAGGSQMTSRAEPRLGHVGGKKDGYEDDVRGRSVEKEDEKPRETSAEARQRRKREMEERLEKEAARPKKKKRIF